MADPYTHQSVFLPLKAAYLYYINGKSQSEIASQLKISITTVSRLLKKAKEDKIIEFVIQDPYLECIHLEEELKELFHLESVVIAPAVVLDEEDDITLEDYDENVRKLVALEGARYLQRVIKENDVLGITWGKTVRQMINYLNPAQKVNATFVTLHGSISSVDNDLDVRTLVTRISKAFSGQNYPLLTEAIMSNKEAADVIKNEKNIRKVYDMFKQIDISISSCGVFYPEWLSILGTTDFISEENLEELRQQGVVGDVALRYFDKDGKECQTSLVDRMITIDFEDYKRIPTKIMMAAGNSKAYTLFSALEGELVDVLIVDYNLGTEILRLKKEKESQKNSEGESNSI